ncbi:MAG: XRE family transcriptional regulator [Chloroflexi bacterium]|nr:XRE family transcriptional regulator [Chloroflexota bacterium]
MDPPTLTLGDQLRALREKRLYSQIELARRAGVSPGFISRLERGVDGYTKPKSSSLKKLMYGLGLSFEEGELLMGLAHPGRRETFTGAVGLIDPDARHEPPASESAEAYVLVDVEPPNAAYVAASLAGLRECVWSAAVWGPFEVVARLRASSASSLFQCIDALHVDPRFTHVRRTETLLIRTDEPKIERVPDHRPLAFLFMQKGQVDSRGLVRMLADIPLGPRDANFVHAAVTMGAYDVAATIAFPSLEKLEELVMAKIQSLSPVIPGVGRPVARTVTALALTTQVYGISGS